MMYNGVPMQQQNMSIPPPNIHAQIVPPQYQHGIHIITSLTPQSPPGLLPLPGMYPPPPQVPPYPVSQNYRGVPLHNSHSAPNLNPISQHMMMRMTGNGGGNGGDYDTGI